jgi:hypothetical protein
MYGILPNNENKIYLRLMTTQHPKLLNAAHENARDTDFLVTV